MACDAYIHIFLVWISSIWDTKAEEDSEHASHKDGSCLQHFEAAITILRIMHLLYTAIPSCLVILAKYMFKELHKSVPYVLLRIFLCRGLKHWKPNILSPWSILKQEKYIYFLKKAKPNNSKSFLYLFFNAKSYIFA